MVFEEHAETIIKSSLIVSFSNITPTVYTDLFVYYLSLYGHLNRLISAISSDVNLVSLLVNILCLALQALLLFI